MGRYIYVVDERELADWIVANATSLKDEAVKNELLKRIGRMTDHSYLVGFKDGVERANGIRDVD